MPAADDATRGTSEVSLVLETPGSQVYRLLLPLPIKGFGRFITAWLIRTDNGNVIVDPGPTATLGSLTATLQDLGVTTVQAVLLTHIHIDHAGGVAGLLSKFPEAKVTVHPRAYGHLINPSDLWQGSVSTLGSLAECYGKIEPLNEACLRSNGSLPVRCEIIETPGHASHHQSYVVDLGLESVLFAGEALGVYLNSKYLRPATPPRFFFDVAYQSVTRLRRSSPSLICYGHVGFTRDIAVIAKAGHQLILWREIISTALRDDPGIACETIVSRLLAEDPCLAGFRDLEDDVASREMFFLGNSVTGFISYLTPR